MLRSTRSLSCALAVAMAPAQSGWTQQVGPAPPWRSFFSMAYDLARGTSVAFGGWANGSAPLGDTWEWNGAQWTQRLISGPSARCCYALAYDMGRGRIVLFGGTTGGGTGDFDETWEYDGTAWLLLTPGPRPLARRMTSMAFDAARSTVLLFGGGVGGNGTPIFNDTWEWDGAAWTPLLPAASPPTLWAHGMATDFARSQVVVYGGSQAGSTVPRRETWVWNGATWRHVVGAVQPPPPMTRVALTYDAQRAMVLLSARAQVQETWLFDGAQWHQDARAAALPPRESCGLVYDWLRARTVLFGGFAGTSLGDTWEYDTAGMAAWAARGPGCPGAAGVPELRAAVRPVLGTTFTLEVTNAGAGALVAIGFSDASWNGAPLPQSLATLGMPGCDLHIRPDVAFATVPAGLTARLDWPLPPNPGLAGVTFFAQALVLSPGTNALGAVVSNSGRGTTGVF